jgi:hypothetical protein
VGRTFREVTLEEPIRCAAAAAVYEQLGKQLSAGGVCGPSVH